MWLLALGTSAQTPTAPLEGRLSRLPEGPSTPRGAALSVRYLLETAERIEGTFPEAAAQHRARAAAHLERLEAGVDPYPNARGLIRQRGYVSPASTRVQGYAVYLPRDYDPARSYPLMVVLHGGSSNGNLFLGVVLGNNMNWKEYDQHLWDEFTPRWFPDWIVAAPDGFGQVMWRFMGERDVFDVIADVQRHYSVDRDRIVLSGLSNGGVGAYSVGARQGHWFSVVQAIAGAPSWVLYAGERSVVPPERVLLEAHSALSLLPNLSATDFRYYHGRVDPGPMRPAYVQALDSALADSDVKARGEWFDAGHDLLYLVHRHGRSFPALAEVRRDPSPSRVHLRSGDLRAARQHWATITAFERAGELGELRAEVKGGTVHLTSSNVAALSLDLRSLPDTGATLRVQDGDQVVLDAARKELGTRVHLHRVDNTLRPGWAPEAGLEKRLGLSGPLTDAYWGRMVHVYGTAAPDREQALRALAEKGALGSPKWLWGVQQEVVADHEVTPELASAATLVLYGTPGDNRVLTRLSNRLPIQVDAEAVQLGERRFGAPDVGVRYIYPNPEAPERYVIVQAGSTVRAVGLGHNLPDFLPDYVVYDAKSARIRPRLVPGRPPPLARGFFDVHWRLPVSGP